MQQKEVPAASRVERHVLDGRLHGLAVTARLEAAAQVKAPLLYVDLDLDVQRSRPLHFAVVLQEKAGQDHTLHVDLDVVLHRGIVLADPLLCLAPLLVKHVQLLLDLIDVDLEEQAHEGLVFQVDRKLVQQERALGDFREEKAVLHVHYARLLCVVALLQVVPRIAPNRVIQDREHIES